MFPSIATALSSGDGPEARRLVDAALAQPGVTSADRARLLLDRGLADQLLDSPNDALADLTQAINVHALAAPDAVRAFLERGLVLDRMNRLNDAVGDYGAAIALAPGSPAALNNRANALRRLNRAAEARRDYQASLAAGNPQPEYPYYGLGQIAESEGRTAEARDFYAKAVAAAPSYALAADRLAALGGPPPDTMAEAAPIILRPPRPTGETPIVLKPPAGAPDPAPIHLHLPGQAPADAGPTITPASYGGDPDGDQPGLRPALDTRSRGAATGQQVQLGAWRDETEAAQGWNHIVKQAGGALDGFSPHIVAADLPGRGRYYRLRAGPLGKADAARLCTALVAKGLDCLPARD